MLLVVLLHKIHAEMAKKSQVKDTGFIFTGARLYHKHFHIHSLFEHEFMYLTSKLEIGRPVDSRCE